MQIERGRMHSPALNQPGFSKPPKSFDTIYVTGRGDKFIAAVIDSKMLGISQIHQPVIASPSIRVNDAIGTNFASNNALKALFRSIWDYFCIHVSIAFKDSKDDGFTSGAPASFAFGSSGTKVRFINFNLTTKRRFVLAKLSNASSNRLQILVHRITTKMGQFGYLSGGQIQAKKLQKLPEFGL